MQKFYFEIADANPPIACSGQDLPCIVSARKFALKYASQILSEQPDSFWDGGDLVMTVTDADHLSLFTLDVLNINAPSLPAPLKKPCLVQLQRLTEDALRIADQAGEEMIVLKLADALDCVQRSIEARRGIH